MKDPLNRTKVVVRRLPPTIAQSALTEQIDGRFSGRYRWFSFRPGKHSQKNQLYSRAYIDFENPDDVVEFAEFFDGHIFVNEKGSQFKALVEYAPFQRVPKPLSKKDGREGTLFKDPEYVAFLEFIAKPVENLPSAEIQLERREAERAGAPKESVIVTPLMDFIRQKRATTSGYQRSSTNGKLSRRAGATASSSLSSSKRGSEKRRGPTSVYVLRDSSKAGSNGKEKSTFMLASRKEELVLATEDPEEKTVNCSNGTIPLVSGSVDIGKRRVLLLKGKEREAPHGSGPSSQHQNATSPTRNLTGSTSSKQSSRREASGRIIRSILSNKDTRQSQSYLSGIQAEQQTQEVNSEREKRPPRPPNPHQTLKDHTTSDKNEKRTRNKDRPDRGVWTPRRSDGVHVNDVAYLSAQQLSSSKGISVFEQTARHKDGDDAMGFPSAHGQLGRNSSATYDAPLRHGAIKPELFSSTRNAESQGVHASDFSTENGAHRYVGRRGSEHGMKEDDCSLNFCEGKLSKRGVSAGYVSNERQVWVQKSGSGS